MDLATHNRIYNYILINLSNMVIKVKETVHGNEMTVPFMGLYTDTGSSSFNDLRIFVNYVAYLPDLYRHVNTSSRVASISTTLYIQNEIAYNYRDIFMFEEDRRLVYLYIDPMQFNMHKLEPNIEIPTSRIITL